MGALVDELRRKKLVSLNEDELLTEMCVLQSSIVNARRVKRIDPGAKYDFDGAHQLLNLMKSEYLNRFQ